MSHAVSLPDFPAPRLAVAPRPAIADPRERSPLSRGRAALSFSEEPFSITGATPEELRRALSVLGPVRDGVRYAAVTDWEVTYRVSADRVVVEVRAVVRLPALRAPRAMQRDLVQRWERYVEALRRHEMGHVAIARAAGEAVLEALADLPPDAPRDVAARVASAALAEVRAAERAYDVETRHGASQGAVFFS